MKHFLVLLVLAGVAFGAVEDESINREPAVEEPTSEEERLVPYLDDQGALNGYLTEKVQLPESDLAKAQEGDESEASVTPD